MSNYVGNKIVFYGEDENVKKILEEIKSEKQPIDFNRIIPMPNNIFRGNLGIEEEQKYGKDNRYDWSIENWGTKWNAYNTCLTEDDEGNTVLFFNTAWKPPMPIIEKLCEICHKSNVDLMGIYSNEDFDSDCHGLWDCIDGMFNDYPLYKDEVNEVYTEIWGV